MRAARVRFGLAALVLAALPALAQAPQTSPRPMPRPVALAPGEQDLAATVQPAPAAPAPAADPSPDAVDAAVAAALAAAEPAPGAPASAAAVSPRPRPRPAAVAAAAAAAPEPAAAAPTETAAAAPTPAAAPAPPEKKRRGLAALFGGGNRDDTAETPRRDNTRGYVCGDPDIKGEELAPITSKVRGCGVAEPVRVTSVDGITLSPGATITCETAAALKQWVRGAVKPTFGRRQIVGLTVAASYTCRPRNNIRGARISEHGAGKAIDISGFILKNGTELTVRGDYGGNIRKVHKAACGTFGTTLGPGSDGYHEDHLHLDTASYRNGPYCR